MRKLNNRTIFFSCVSLVFGIALSSYQSTFKILAVFFLFASFFGFVYCLIKNGDGVPKIITAMFMLAFFILGICLGFTQQIVYSKLYQSYEGVVSCEIIEVSQTQFVAKNITVADETKLGRIIVTYENSGEYEVGDVVTFEGEITPIEIFENGAINYQYSSRITYRASISEISESYHRHTFATYIKNAILEIQTEMFGDNVGIAYAMTFGDSALVDYTSLSLLRRGGVAHIFAVSGLHIGILYGLLRMFSWLKLRSSLKEKAIYNGACLLILLFYVYLCDFTASSVRAFLMIFIGIILTRFGLIKDRLTAISLSAFIIMLYSPYIIFTVGFQLSFLTVLGLAILPEKIEKHLEFLKFRKLKKSVAFAISAFVSTALVSCYHFGYLSTISVLLNLIVVPIYSIVYVANLIGMGVIAICNLFSFDYIIAGICPYFTNEIFNYTITIFGFVEEVIPLALYFTIPLGLVVGGWCFMLIRSGLVSDAVSKGKIKILSYAMLGICLVPIAVSFITIDKPGITFYDTSTQVLTIQTESETYIFCQSGGSLDFSNVETLAVHVIVYDNYYQDISVSGGENLDISIYAEFLNGTPTGANTLSDFQSQGGNVSFSGYQTVEYDGVYFDLSGSGVYVSDLQSTYQISSAGYTYYITDGIFTSNESYEASR
ncbi:MAG: ComEC/Rec2 family competence protein [Bacillota bacterium]